MSNEARLVILVGGERNYINFSVDYLIRTMCLLSGVLCNTPPRSRLQLLSDRSTSG